MPTFKQNIINKIKLITGKKYKLIEKALDKLDEKELKQFSQLMNEINFKINDLRKKARRFFNSYINR